MPGYAMGGLAELEHKYAEGGPVASLPTYDINVRANRIRTPRRPAPREELTADQLNGMVLDALARRAAAESEAGAAAEARDRIGRTMGYAEGGLAELEHKYEGGGPVSLLTGLARRVMRNATPALRPDEVPMVATHNAREIGLQKIADNGGEVVAPSIGISRADDPMDSFGEISLIASPQTVDPRRTPVYGRDAYTPRYPSVIPMTVRGREKDYVRLYNDDTGESRLLPHTPRNALRVMTNDPWRGGEDFITDNWLLGQMTPQFRNMSELRGARDRLVPRTDKSVEDWQNQLSGLRQEFRDVLPDSIRDNFNFIDSHTRNMAEAVQRGPGGMEYINRNYYNNAIPEELLERTRAHLEAGRDLPATYFEAKPRRIVPLNEFQGAVVPQQASKDVTDLLRRYGVDDIQYYNRGDEADRAAQIRRFERLMFGAAPVAAGAAVEAAADAPEPEGYAEGGRVNSDWSQYLPEDMPESAYIDHRNTMTRPLNVRRLIDVGAIRITDPAGDPSGEGFSVVSRWNDVSPESATPRWADRPSARSSAINALSQPGSLFDGKYRQILQSARELGLSLDEVFLPERESRAEGGLAELHQKYARGGDVISDAEYDRRLLERMKRDTGRTTESTNAEQAQALRSAGYDAAELASDIFLPQSPLDAALMVALGPGPRMARLAGSAALAAMEPSEAEAGVVRRVGRALGRAGTGSAEDALEAAATPVAPTRRRGTIGIIPEETPRAPAVMPSAAREANAAVDLQDETLRAYLDRNSTREPTVRTLPEGEDILGLRNYDLSQVPDVPQVDLPRVVPPRGVSARMSDLVSNEDVWREYSDLVRNGRDNLQGREWYNMEPLRHAFVRELGEDEGTAAFRHYTQNIAATSPRSNIIDNMRNASYYFVQEPSGLILPVRQPAPYGHLAQNLHRQNVETIRSPEGWDLFKNPKPPSFAENLGGNQRPGTMDAHALSVPSILSRDPRFLTTDLRIPSGGDYFNLKPRASYGRGVFTMDEAVRRPQLWDAAPNPNEYGALEQRFRRLGEDLDMTTAQAQASGWVGGGRISGLTSPPLPAVDVFQRVVNRTAAQEGRSPQEVLRGFIHRQNALRAAAPIAIGVGANEELDGYAHGGLAQLHHKYAEGGAVSAQPAIYDPDAVNTLANQIEAGYV
jgi:hypothetical protein